MKAITEFSVKNSLLVNLISVVILVAGLMSLSRLNREAFPNIDFDIVSVTTYYPGATPEEIEKLITIPVEKELKSVENIKEINSVSASGISLIYLQLEENADDKQIVVNDIQRAVDSTEDLPADLQNRPVVRDIKTKDTPVIEVSLSGDLPEDQIRTYALALEKKILDLDDVANVQRKGLRDKQIWVEVTPEIMREKHIDFNEVIRALQIQNSTLPGGKFYDENRVEYILKTSGDFKDKEDVKKTVVRAGTLGTPVSVADIANVTDQFAEETVINKTEGTRSVILTVIKKEKGDSIRLVEDLKTISADFAKSADPKLKIRYVNDMSFYIQRRLNVLINNGLIGLLMVSICLFIFLSFGSAASACLGIPTALLMTFSAMSFFGISLNLLSLFGLIMVLGMLVDEDIVIAENVHRYIEEDSTDIQNAAVKGANEVSKAVTATVLTTIVAFIPIYFMSGIMGKFTRHIPTVIMITLTASLIEALFILPSHVSHITELSHKFKAKWAALFAKRKSAAQKKHKGHVLLDKTLKRYTKILDHTLRFRYIYVLVLLAAFGGSIKLAERGIHKFQLFPTKGVEIFFIRAEAEVGTSLEDMSQKMRELENLVATLDKNELDTYVTSVGLSQNDPNDPNTRRGTHIGQITVYLTPEAQRTRSAEEILEGLRQSGQSIKTFPKLSFDSIRNGPPSGRPVEVRIKGDDFETMQKIADRIAEQLKKIEGVYDVQDDYDLDKDEIQIQIDAVRAAQMGLNARDISLHIRYAFEGFEATSIASSEDEVGVVVKFPPAFRQKREALENLLIPNGRGGLIALGQVATFSKNKSAQSVLHWDGSRNINVSANLDSDKLGILEVQSKLTDALGNFMDSYPGYSVAFGGEGERTNESLDDLKKAFGFSIVLIIFILVATFRSFVLPIINGLIIPFTMIGVIIAFELHGEPLSFMAILGLVALTGIVVDAGTILIDFISKFREAGVPLHEAILKGSALRFRAVMLITLTSVLGLLPSAYGIGGNDPFISPMAMALNYGMVFSTVLTLIYVPIFLHISEDIKAFFSSVIDKIFKARKA